MLGAAQEAWLRDGLRSGAGWNLIAQQVFVMPVRRRMPGGEVKIGAGDAWGGYPEARALGE
nr:alkaline phosphatase D family protein [Brevundimonas sp.]